MPAPIAADLRTLVARRVGLKRRVAVLAADDALRRALETNGCDVLMDPPSSEELRGFEPDVAVVFDGFVQGDDPFVTLAAAAPGAELILSYANASSATSLLHALTGGTQRPGLAEPDVRRFLASAGYVAISRDVVVVPHESTGLSTDTEVALRQLLEQLNPDAAADRFLIVARRGRAAVDARTPGLLSVIVSAGDDVPALEGTLRSLAGQQRRPLELLVVSSVDAEPLLDPLRARSGLDAHHVLVTGDLAARLNAGLARATGQYVAFLEAGDLLEPLHLTTLIRRLESGTAAWALGTCRVGAAIPDLPPRFSLQAWLSAGAVEPCSYVLDRARLGTFALTFAEGTPAASSVLFARLALLFPPSWVMAAPSVERLHSTSTPVADLRQALQAKPLRSLTTLSELLEEPPAPELAQLLKRRAFESMEALVRRVQQAAREAKQAADAERKR